MKIAIESFRGMAPRITPRALPENGAQRAINARLQSGDLQAWRQFLLEETLANPNAVQSIYRLNGSWLSWESDVDVARGVIPGDNTFRVYLTGPDEYTEPRWTNYALATTGSAPFPVTTRPIGVPDPDSAPTLAVGQGAIPSVTVSDAGDQLASSWTISPVVSGVSSVTQSGAIGNPVPSYRLDYINSNAFAYRDFGVSDSASVNMGVDVAFLSATIDAGVRVRCTAAGSGLLVGLGVIGGVTQFFIGTASSWGGVESALVQTPSPALDNTASVFYRIEVRTTINPTGTLTVTAEMLNGVTVLATLTTTGSFDLGGFCGVDGNSAGSQVAFYDNFLVEGSGSVTAIQSVATSYVYTFVNDIGEESAPSPASATVLRPDGVSIAVTTPTSLPTGVSTDYGIATKRIYRAVTGATGSIFRFVAEVALATADYVDVLTDAELGEALESEGWELPPDDLRGILALPNGIMVGFRRNQLCFSAQNRPHAWPVAYRLTTDTDIVGIGAIDSTVVIGTKSFPYVASGSSPDSYAMQKLGVPQACVSKRSIGYLIGIGVVFASPDGLIAVAGTGQVRNLTETIFTRKQWQALNPDSILGISHDDIYFFFYDLGGSSDKAGYALDMKQSGFGLVEWSFHATAAYADPETDILYLSLDDYTDQLPSTGGFQLEGGGIPVPAVYAFDSDPSSLMNYRWKGRLNLLPRPSAPQYCRVQAEDFDSLLLTGTGDGTEQFEEAVVSGEEFTLPNLDEFSTYELEVVGTSTVRRIQVAESIDEID
jgi:hypothetical protein